MIKGPVVDMDNRFNKVFPFFDSLNLEFTPGCRIIDSFSSCVLFYSFNKHGDKSLILCLCQLDEITIISLENPSHALVITNASIKNNMATSIAYIYIHNRSVVKILHHTVNINNTEAKLFVIRYDINQATNSIGISKIVIITDSIHAAKKIFDPSLHLFQTHLVSILCEL